MDAIQRAYDIIRKQLNSGAWIPGQRLPSLYQLAEICTVSRSTMWRVLDKLKKESLVHAHRGGAIIAGPSGSKKPGPAHHGYAWEQLKDRIGRDILAGSFLSNERVPINKMARRYGVAIDTLKKALAGLVQDGILTREGRWYQRTLGPARKQSAAMVLVSGGSSEKGVSISDPRTEHVIEAFERECFQLGFQSRCEGFDSRDPSALIKITDRVRKIGDIAGFVVNMWSDWIEAGWRRWLDMLGFVASRAKPVVVLDQDSGLIFPADLLRNDLFRVLRIAGIRAGEAVGRYLIGLGHRRIAFFTPGSLDSWVRNRYEGLSQSAQIYGPGVEIELFTGSESADAIDLTLSLLDLKGPDIRSLFKNRVIPAEINSLVSRLSGKTVERLRKTIIPGADKLAAASFGRFMAKFSRQKLPVWIHEYLLDALIHIASNTVGEQYLVPFLGMVLKNSRATAWVCTEDKTAFCAVTFLEKNGKKVPEDISVIGFENWREAREHQMSTYDFNMNGMVQQALHMILDQKLLKSRPAISEVDGYIVGRRTTGQ